MPITLGANISSLRTKTQLDRASAAVSKSFERLSSGLRINRAGDDPAAQAISSKLNADARVFARGSKNLNDGISLLNLMDGAMSAMGDILSRTRELAVQAANGSYSDTQRQALDQEFQSLAVEYNRIIESTQFNGIDVFSEANSRYILQGGYGTEGATEVSIDVSGLENPLFIFGEEMARIGLGPAGVQPNGGAGSPVLSADGRYVVYQTAATNLETPDGNGVLSDVFVYDRETGVLDRITDLQAGDSNTFTPAVSADGRYVTFTGAHPSLGDTNGFLDVYRYDRETDQTILISSDDGGVEGNAASGNNYQSISDDGNLVVFSSQATNLVAGGDFNGTFDIFVRDVNAGTTTRVSVDSLGGEAFGGDSTWGQISGNGRYVLYASNATNLVAGDTNGSTDLFVYDMETAETSRVSVASDGSEGDGITDNFSASISEDGRYVTFTSSATNLVADDTNINRDAFVHDRQTGVTSRVSVQADGSEVSGGATFFPTSISSDGRFVMFNSDATNLVSGDTNGRRDVFVRDMQTGAISRISVADSGTQSNHNSYGNFISRDGAYVVMGSDATNLAGTDSNGFSDIYVGANSLLGGDYALTYMTTLSVDTQSNALSAIDSLDLYTAQLEGARNQVGTGINRLQIAAGHLDNTGSNYLAAAARITDVDVAEEVANMVAAQIRVQVSAALLAQSNSLPEIVLQLLKN